MELCKKIAFGAYYITLKQNDGKNAAYIASKIAIFTAGMVWFLFFTFLLTLFGVSYGLPPFKYILSIFLLISMLIPLKRKDMESILTVNNKEYINNAVKIFWLSIFGPVAILLIILILLKLLKII